MLKHNWDYSKDPPPLKDNKMLKFNVNTTHSPIKWAGGKSWLTPKIWETYQYHQEKRFVELFAGGLGASFAFKPKQVLANDKNKYLINFYNEIKKDGKLSLDLKNEEETYYEYRNLYNSIKDDPMHSRAVAELFYYINRCGYNGLYRVNRKGLLNVPFGRYKYANPMKDLSEYTNTIKNWEFTNLDFADVSIRDSDFIFCDSPYDTEFTSYTEDGFIWEDQIRLMEFLKDKKSPIILTNQATKRMIDLVSQYGFNIEYVVRPRNFSRNSKFTEEQKREIYATRNI